MPGAIVGAVVGSAVSEFVVGTVLAEAILGAAITGTTATIIGTAVGAVAGSIASSAVNDALAETPPSPASPAPISIAPSLLDPSAAATAALFETQERGLLINTAGTDDPIPVVYGTRRVGGVRVLTEVSGQNREYLNLVFVWGEGRIEAVDDVFLDGVSISDPRFSGFVYAEHRLGDDSQPSVQTLINEIPSKWTTSHYGGGLAYTYLRLKWDRSAFNGLPTATADIRGRRLYDVRNGQTAFSSNPALAIYDYLTSSRYGRKIPASAIDTASFIAAANTCDAIITVPTNTAGGTTTITQYSCDGAISVDVRTLDNVKSLLSACRGYLNRSAGKYRLGIDGASSPTGFVFSEDNIIGGWSIKLPNKKTMYNRCRAKFFNRTTRWQPDVATFDSPTYRTQDREILLEREMELPHVSDYYRAFAMAQVETQISRQAIAVQLTAAPEALRCEIGDVVAVTHQTPGWSGELFKVAGMSIKSNDEVRVALRKYDAGAYAVSVSPYISPRPATNLPDPYFIPVITGLTVASGSSELYVRNDGTVITRAKLSWNAVLNIFVINGGTIEMEFKRSVDSAWSRGGVVNGQETVGYITDVNDATTYDFRVRAVSGLNVAGAWSTPVMEHTVIGKTQPPADVSTFLIDGRRLSWGHVADRDVAGYELRFLPGQNINWPDAQPLHEGRIAFSPWTMERNPVGPTTLMIKAVDTSGNKSVNPAFIITDFGDPVIANVLDTYNRKVVGWPGTKTNCTVSGGNLLADTEASPLLWYNDSTNFWTLDGSLMWGSTQYKQMIYSDSLVITRAFEDSRLTWSTTIVGEGAVLEYRQQGPGRMWSTDHNAMWTSDAALMWLAAPSYTAWPGQIEVLADTYDFRVTIPPAINVQSGITAFVLTVDAPDISETLADVVISAGGTRLLITKDYVTIRTVNLTLQQDGGSARTPRVIDKHADLGPLVQCLDSSGVGTSGTVDVIIQGY